MNIKLTYRNHLSRKRKITKARRKAKNSWSEKKKNLLAHHGYLCLSNMLKLGTHFFSHAKKEHNEHEKNSINQNQ